MNKMNIPPPFEDGCIPGIFSLSTNFSSANSKKRKKSDENQIIEEDEEENPRDVEAVPKYEPVDRSELVNSETNTYRSEVKLQTDTEADKQSGSKFFMQKLIKAKKGYRQHDVFSAASAVCHSRPGVISKEALQEAQLPLAGNHPELKFLIQHIDLLKNLLCGRHSL